MKNRSSLNDLIKQGRSGLIALIGFGFVANILLLATPLYMIQIFDRVLNSGSKETLLFLTFIVIIALLVSGIMESVRKRLLNRIGNWLDKSLSPKLLKASMQGALSGMPASAQSLRDLGSIRQFITGPLRTLTDLLWVPIFLAAVSVLHLWLGILAVVFGAMLITITWLNEVATRKPLSEASEEHIKNQHLADLAVRNADVLQAMGMFNPFSEGWQQSNHKILAKRQIASDRSSTLFGMSRFLRMAAQAGVLGLGAYLVLGNQLTPGGMIAGSILLARALGPLEQAISSWRGFVNARSSYGRIRTLLEISDQKKTQSNLPKPNGKLVCEDVTYFPKGHQVPALNRVNFTLDQGSVLGIIGPSSAGKTTLCKILVGTWQPNDGHARLGFLTP
ncbi:type I secretion system permease/ATPase [Pseudemcibacter aquimaris]|uniref:type I secretion system permease/ATPase n=1 Tax=Pseudemcibacter aquimaris TaxID=2857064 RepID=UPI002012B50A|nr:ABC transporter transmembrane domain-containing protein [Pseudemcibacter aquimaris]MCC3862549.1 ATP-binding cassette domain-containing protein [Pseudemcibacter aquimaris]WDU57932.1 ATP-binding cassette domain-containing protein [Pseudemcibacter aquimaris]